MSACDKTGLSSLAFDHKQIIKYFDLTLQACLIKKVVFNIKFMLIILL